MQLRYLISTIRTSSVYIENLIPNNALEALAFYDHDPKAVQEFERLKALNGGKTKYAFHGTKPDCVYSIVRNGLRNLSGSMYMTTG